MSEKIMIQNKHSKIFSIEFLRVFFVFIIIFGHCMQCYPEIKSLVYNFFKSDLVPTWFCVEYYAIIGGFLIYYNWKKEVNLFDRIKHVYIRLVPAVLLLYVLGLIFGLVTESNLPFVLTMTQGLSIPIADAIGWGDWFAGAYFWSSCLLISLLFYFKDKAFLYILPLIYVCLVMQHHTQAPIWMTSFHSIIGSEFLRIVYCMGIGMVAAFVSKNIEISKRKLSVFFASILEAICLYICFKKIIYGTMFFGITAILSLGIFLALAANSAGYISMFFNKMRKIYYVSRYSWSIFIGHAFVLTLIQKRLSHYFNIDWISACISVFIGAIIFGIFEYHVIEKRLVPWVLNYFKKDSKNIFM